MLPNPHRMTQAEHRQRASFRLKFRCPECGHQARAAVQTWGHGRASVPTLAGAPEDAAERAKFQSGRMAFKRANVLLSLATCPSCGARDVVAAQRLVRQTRRGAVLAGLLPGACAATLLLAVTWPQPGAIVFAAGLVVFNAAYGFVSYRRAAVHRLVREVDDRVDFELEARGEA